MFPTQCSQPDLRAPLVRGLLEAGAGLPDSGQTGAVDLVGRCSVASALSDLRLMVTISKFPFGAAECLFYSKEYISVKVAKIT